MDAVLVEVRVFPYQITFYGGGALPCQTLVVFPVTVGRGEGEDMDGVNPSRQAAVGKQFFQMAESTGIVHVSVIHYRLVEAEVEIHRFAGQVRLVAVLL